MDEQTENNQKNSDIQPVSPPTATEATAQQSAPARIKIVGVRFKRAGRIYYFDPKGFDLNWNDWVIVETARGLEIGRVVLSPRQVLVSEIEMPLKAVVRKAEPAEAAHSEEVEKKEREALVECGKMVARLGLPMKLLSAEYSLEGNHITFFFSAAERVDFRELVRELAGRFRVRVELRQVGARDEAKIMGGYGRCGRQLCCASWLSEFQPISIKMAKEQGLPLNPMKISGVCGRLLCCLSYEHLLYRDMRAKMPREGQIVSTSMGNARVVGSNPLKETVVVELESKMTTELPVAEIKIIGGAPEPERVNSEDKEAEALERENPKL